MNILHGTPGLFLSYAAIEAPMLWTLIRRRARPATLLKAAGFGVPLVAIAGMGSAAAWSLLPQFGAGVEGSLRLIAGFGIHFGAGIATARWLMRDRPARVQYQRGTRILEAHDRDGVATLDSGARASRAHTAPLRSLTLAGLEVNPADETKHFKFIGTTGTGKSTAIRELLGGALERGDRAIVADPDGGYLRSFFDPSRGDAILNPFDSRSRKWDLFGEIRDAYDVDQLARSLLPDQGAADRTWIGYARTFFAAVTRRMHESAVRDPLELYRLLVTADASELRVLVSGTAAQPFLDPQNARMFDSVRSVASSALSSLEYIASQSGEPLSIRDWVRGGSQSAIATDGTAIESRVLFLPYHAPQIAALRSTISAWMRLAIFEAMSAPETDRRLWFVVDELDALGTIDGLRDALARLRKFGGRCVLGFQSAAQVTHTYGREEAQTIVENCGNTLILRCSGSDHGGTASFAARLIGQREVLRTNLSRTRRPTEWLASRTESEHVNIEPAILDSQIEQLRDLEGFLKFASSPSWRRVTLQPSDCHSVRSNARAAWSQWRCESANAANGTGRSAPTAACASCAAGETAEIDRI